MTDRLERIPTFYSEDMYRKLQEIFYNYLSALDPCEDLRKSVLQLSMTNRLASYRTFSKPHLSINFNSCADAMVSSRYFSDLKDNKPLRYID